MELRKIFIVAYLLLTLVTFGCAGTGNYQASSGPPSNNCNGDVPSPYPPFCRPSR
jgi:hypothetical protein